MADALTEWSLAAETKEWVGPIVVLADDVPVTDFEVTLTGPGQRPTTWTAPTVLGAQRGLLVGADTDYELAVGVKYTLWIRYTDAPEIPVIRCGLVRVY